MTEQWHEGEELVINAGFTDAEIRSSAINAAASAWAGISSVRRDRDGQIIETARRFAEYIVNGPGGSEAVEE